MKNHIGFITASEAQHESTLSCLPSAGAVKAHGAFTLIETLVAISILTLAIAGPLTTANRALVAAEISRDQLTASYLAQEGVEYVRMVRDDAYLDAYKTGGANVSSTAWTTFVSGAKPSVSIGACQGLICTLDPTNPVGSGSGKALQVCGSPCNPVPPLFIRNGVYTMQSSGVQTSFARTIQISAVSANEEKIISTVTWNFHGLHSISITDHLTPWQ